MSADYFVENEMSEESPVQCRKVALHKDKVWTKPHIHSRIELLYCIEGKMKVVSGDSETIISKGDFIIIESYMVHSIYALTDGENINAVIKFFPELLIPPTASASEFSYFLPFVLRNEKVKKHFTSKELEGSVIPEAVDEIANECLERRFGYEIAVRLNINRIFLWVLREWEKEGVWIDSKEKNLTAVISPALGFVHENYTSDINLADAAKVCHVSESYFSRSFKKLTGRSFSEYINFVRLANAKKLLISSALSVTEVGFASGFSSTSYFITKFRRFYGETPYSYRNKLQGSWDET